MPTTTAVVVNEGANQEWSVTGAAGAPAAVQTDDSDTSYISAGEERLHELVFNSISIPAGATITNITFYARVRRTATNGLISLTVTVNGNTTESTGIVISSSSYTEISISCNQAPGAVPWTAAMFDEGDGVMLGLFTETGSDDVRCTYVYATVTYTVPARRRMLLGIG